MPDLTEKLDANGKVIKIPNEAKKAAQRKLLEDQARRTKYSSEDAKSCSQRAVGDLEALSANARDSMKGANDKILAAIRGISDACSADPMDSAAEEAAIEACESAKKAVGSASPPTDEAETDVTGSSSTSTTTNPFTSTDTGVKSAK